MLDKRNVRTARRHKKVSRRRGIATLWTILFLPVLLLLFIVAVEAGYLWLSRVELENALDAAALAAVKEWGETGASGPGWTLPARQLGVEYAAANTINGVPVAIGLNYDPGKPPNENDSCAGDLIFGALTNDNYQCGDLAIFNAGIRPSCGGGEVLIDATGQGTLKSLENEWGIAFHRDDDTPAGILIERITIDLGDPTDNDAYFNITGVSPLTISDNTNDRVGCPGGTPSQDDVFGFPAPATQIQWDFFDKYFLDTRAKEVVFTFHDDPISGDPGFEPCDRFRFGLNVVRDDTSDQFDGDDLGQPGDVNVTITIEFNVGPPVTATLFDNQDNKKDCACDPVDPYDDFCTNSLIVHPTGIPDLPCPPGDAAKNNGQSYGLTSGGGGRTFAVRAQATVEVPGLICWLCALPVGPFSVSACSTAMYDCIDQRPRLVRVEEFICPGP